MNKHIAKFKRALKDAFAIFMSHYGKNLSDQYTADLYERHLDARGRNPEFVEFQRQAAVALTEAGGISSDWLNTYIPTIVPQEDIWSLIDEVKIATGGKKL